MPHKMMNSHIADVLHDNRLSIEARMLYAYLCSFDDGALPSTCQIIRQLGIGKTRFYRYRNELEAFGLIEVENTITSGGGVAKYSLPTMVNFIFDEFANIGTIPDIEQTIAVTRSRNIGISIILQSVAQLESRYDKKAKTIIDCCDTTLFLGGKSNSTNKEISEMIGKQTINQKTFGETRGQSGSSSKNIQIQGRDLIDAAEIGKMNRREAILLIAGTNPLKDLKYPVEQHPNYIYLDPGRNKPGRYQGVLLCRR